MKPILFPANATTFSTLGIGALNDVISCTVTEERNGIYELQMQYPVTGKFFGSIRNRCIVYAEVNPEKEKQPFRIYRITKPLRGVVTIYAQHLSYDLSGIVLTPFTANTIRTALSGLKTYSSTENPFSFATDKTTAALFSVNQPSSIRSVMGGQAGSLLDSYGGEYYFDHYTVNLLKERGANRGVSIRYGKNLLDLTQEENIQNVYTGVYPFWIQETNYLELPEKVIAAPGTYDFTRIKPLDASSSFNEKPTEAQLRSFAESYVENNQIGVPAVSITVKFAALEQTEEYAEFAHLYQVKLCDTVTVLFDALGVNASAKCIKTVYDTLNGRYSEIALGEARQNITDTIFNQTQGLYDQEKGLLHQWQNIYVQSEAIAKQEEALKSQEGTLKSQQETLESQEETLKSQQEVITLHGETLGMQAERLSELSDEYIQNIAKELTNTITGNDGGYVVLHSSSGKEWPDEILIMDTTSPITAKNVWRWNKSGLGYSSNGYDGPYKLAMTIDGKFVADFIASGSIDASSVAINNLVVGEVYSVDTYDGIENSLLILNGYLEMESTSGGKANFYVDLDGHVRLELFDSSGFGQTEISDMGITTKSIEPAFSGADFEWKYIEAIDETVLVKR